MLVPDGKTDATHHEVRRTGEPIYVDVVSGEPLFASTHQIQSKSGWPSFTRPLIPGNIVIGRNAKYWMTRNEVRSRAADSHLGHFLKDHYCINSAALRFVPAERLEEEGYRQFLDPVTNRLVESDS